MNKQYKKIPILFSLSIFSVFSHASDFQNQVYATTSTGFLRGYEQWMSPEVNDAWKQKYKGSYSKVFVVDDMKGTSGKFYGLLSGTKQLYQSHGVWTSTMVKKVAPGSSVTKVDWGLTYRFNKYGQWSNNPIKLHKTYLNIINASYGVYGASGSNNVGLLHSTVKNFANNGSVFLSKAAGNDAIDMGTAKANGTVDIMAQLVKNSPSTIFAGSLWTNGTPTNKATIASYSNRAGTDPEFQKRFLMVGVDSAKTGMNGTSFAAPIISGYAAIVHNKFKYSTPTQITNQLLNTARTDTINGYSRSVHGVGEASLTRALAPISIQ